MVHLETLRQQLIPVLGELLGAALLLLFAMERCLHTANDAARTVGTSLGAADARANIQHVESEAEEVVRKATRVAARSTEGAIGGRGERWAPHLPAQETLSVLPAHIMSPTVGNTVKVPLTLLQVLPLEALGRVARLEADPLY